MVSFLCATLLLLMCGQLFHQALAVNSLEALEEVYIIAGVFINQDEADTVGILMPSTIATVQPVDMPGFNQYLPLLYEMKVDGILKKAGMYIFPGDGTVLFYDGTANLDAYSTNAQKLKSSTFDAPPSNFESIKPACAGTVERFNDEVIRTFECNTDEPGIVFTSTFTSTCKNVTGTLDIPGAMKTFTQVKVIQLPLPGSWLEGVDEFRSPCGYY